MTATEINERVNAILEDGMAMTIMTRNSLVTGKWTGHGTDFQTGEEDLWIDDGEEEHNFEYGAILTVEPAVI